MLDYILIKETVKKNRTAEIASALIGKPLKIWFVFDLHDVCDDPDAPEVGVEAEGLVVHHLRRDELGGPQHLTNLDRYIDDRLID